MAPPGITAEIHSGGATQGADDGCSFAIQAADFLFQAFWCRLAFFVSLAPGAPLKPQRSYARLRPVGTAVIRKVPQVRTKDGTSHRTEESHRHSPQPAASREGQDGHPAKEDHGKGGFRPVGRQDVEDDGAKNYAGNARDNEKRKNGGSS